MDDILSLIVEFISDLNYIIKMEKNYKILKF